LGVLQQDLAISLFWTVIVFDKKNRKSIAAVMDDLGKYSV
jgi:hypothetical protein